MTNGVKITIIGGVAALAFAAFTADPQRPHPVSEPPSEKKTASDPFFSESEINKRRERERGYWVGMSSDEAYAILGLPKSVNASGDSGGSREQWVYQNTHGARTLYLYFEKGTLTSFQTFGQ